MTDLENDAYRRGQQDMRRRCEALWRNWYMGDWARYMKQIKDRKRLRVDVQIRRKLKIKDLSHD